MLESVSFIAYVKKSISLFMSIVGLLNCSFFLANVCFLRKNIAYIRFIIIFALKNNFSLILNKNTTTMKKILMFAVAFIATMSLNAQNMFIKPMAGINLSTFTDVDNSKMKIGPVGGVEFGYHITDPFYISADLLVSMQGTKVKDSQYEKNRNASVTYINLPIMVNYYVVEGLAFKVGVQPGFFLSQKTTYDEYDNGKWNEVENTSSDYVEKFDFSIPIGLSYEYSNIVLDARYNFGLTKIIDDKYFNKKSKNSVFMITLGYKIPF